MSDRKRTIAIFGKLIKPSFEESLQGLWNILMKEDLEIILFRDFAQTLEKQTGTLPFPYRTFATPDEIPSRTEFLISIGGDGTFLEAIPFILDKQIPIAGINSGRLGFLSDINSHDLQDCMVEILQDEFRIETRSLIEVSSPGFSFDGNPYALNDVSIHKLDSASMITIHTSIDQEYLNSYWADGLIIATPTGSTAYSLSSGGPIVLPQSQNLILTPIAPHTLTVRPLVIPDASVLDFTIEGRNESFLVSLDHRSYHLPLEQKLQLKKSIRSIQVIKPNKHSFFSTLRNKLMWGIDRRN